MTGLNSEAVLISSGLNSEILLYCVFGQSICYSYSISEVLFVKYCHFTSTFGARDPLKMAQCGIPVHLH